jgi:hypothetical protein
MLFVTRNRVLSRMEGYSHQPSLKTVPSIQDDLHLPAPQVPTHLESAFACHSVSTLTPLACRSNRVGWNPSGLARPCGGTHLLSALSLCYGWGDRLATARERSSPAVRQLVGAIRSLSEHRGRVSRPRADRASLRVARARNDELEFWLPWHLHLQYDPLFADLRTDHSGTGDS